jgi:transcriptional regulator
MGKDRPDLLHGTLTLLILKAIERESQHGYQIARTIEAATNDVLKVEEGSLYPALHRMKQRGLIKASWGRSENQRRAKFYEITAVGRKTLHRETEEWGKYASAVGRMLRTSE